jgi:hypothetical protein
VFLLKKLFVLEIASLAIAVLLGNCYIIDADHS